MSFPYSKKDLKSLEVDFRIHAVIADGMWYSLPKWRKLARVTEDQIIEWAERKTREGYLIQSPTGAKSYRIGIEDVLDWHSKNNLEIGEKIFEFIFPARIWDDKTEVEGFLDAPRREIGIVNFECSTQVCNEVKAKLRGVARVRIEGANKYKAYGLSSEYIKALILEVFENYSVLEASRTYSRSSARRRELVDFSHTFSEHLILFYKKFARTLLQKEMETIRIYIPDRQDQDSQILAWVIMAIEKFNEADAVPFSGYLNAVLKRWPYDLPNEHLGKDLSNFQRVRSKAINSLRITTTGAAIGASISNEAIAAKMGMPISLFSDLEEKHQVWLKTKHASPLTWDENSEEKGGSNIVSTEAAKSDAIQTNKLSRALIEAAIESGEYKCALLIISQIGKSTIESELLQTASKEFIVSLGQKLGL